MEALEQLAFLRTLKQWVKIYMVLCSGYQFGLQKSNAMFAGLNIHKCLEVFLHAWPHTIRSCMHACWQYSTSQNWLEMKTLKPTLSIKHCLIKQFIFSFSQFSFVLLSSNVLLIKAGNSIDCIRILIRIFAVAQRPLK